MVFNSSGLGGQGCLGTQRELPDLVDLPLTFFDVDIFGVIVEKDDSSGAAGAAGGCGGAAAAPSSLQPSAVCSVSQDEARFPDNDTLARQRERLFGSSGKVGDASQREGAEVDLDRLSASFSKMAGASMQGSPGRVQRAFELGEGEGRKARLASAFALVVGKLAEDDVGHVIEGDDMWDVRALGVRRFTGRSLYSCRMSRDRRSILLILDSSPSCQRLAEFYQGIAKLAAQYGDIEIYDAPNGFLTRRWDCKSRSWKDLEEDDRSCDTDYRDDWSWKGRRIIFFGDYDGFEILEKASQHNQVWWLNPDLYSPGGWSERRYRESGAADRYRGKAFPCANEDDLLVQARRMR